MWQGEALRQSGYRERLHLFVYIDCVHCVWPLASRSERIFISATRKITQLSLVWRLTIQRKNRDGDE